MIVAAMDCPRSSAYAIDDKRVYEGLRLAGLTHTRFVCNMPSMTEKTSTVNISFRQDLLKQIDEVARTESRSRSELVREAARMYIERKRRMDAVIESIRQTVRERGITEADVADEIAAVRAERKQRRS